MFRRIRAITIALTVLAGAVTTVTASVQNFGFADLFELDSVTVVYPARPIAEAETHRRSAEARARFLRTVHGVEVRVIADADFSKDDHRADLLLLGWDNRVLGNARAVRPFLRDGGTVAFLGEQAPVPGADLAFRHRSPYDADRKLFFWSRIDPEIDRFMMLPAFGSDWAWFDVFLPVTQGMFTDDRSWPPTRNPEAERRRGEVLADRRASLAKKNSMHFVVRFDPEAFTPEDIETIVRAREDAFAEAESALGAAPEGFKIDLWVYVDREDKESFTGVAGDVHSVVRDRALHMTTRYARSSAPHEEIHHLARQRFGPTYSTAMYEGLSFSYRPTFRGQSLGFHAAMLLEQEALPGIDVLFDEARLRTLPQVTSFAASGLLATWIRTAPRTGGIEQAWALAWPDGDRYAAVAGRPLEELDRAFRTWVRKYARDQRTEVEFVRWQEQARERHLAGDYAGVASALTEALAIKPDDHQTAFNLASAEMRIAEYEAAERRLLAILDAGLPPGHELRVYGHFQLARLYDVMGRRDEAVAQYRAVLALPDLQDSHRSAQEGIDTPFTADRLQ